MHLDKSNKKGHGFSDRPFYSNTNATIYSTELWHYGVPGMHWGEITKGYVKVGSKIGSAIKSKISSKTVSPIKDAISKIANLENIKKKMRQKHADQSNPNIVRYDNKVLTINPRHKTEKDIANSGAKAINTLVEKKVKPDNTKDYSYALEQVLKTRKVKGR
jgi:phage-related protein